MPTLPPYREITIAPGTEGMRLDRWLALRFADRSRSYFARAIRDGLVVTADGRRLDCAHRVTAGLALHLYVPGIAPGTAPPPFPPILHEDARLIAVDKPAGLLAHPAGSAFVWAVISLAKRRYPDERVDLVHRLDRDTSGVLVLTRDLDANRRLKEAIHDGELHKEYEAIVKGVIPWDHRLLDGPIGPADGPIRVQMAVRDDGLDARTEVEVLDRTDRFTRVRCILHTGRTHQIRVHLAHAGFGLLGDRLYGVPPEVFLRIRASGVDDQVIAAAGAPRHALHARRTTLPHPDGGTVTIEAPTPPDLARWWARPEVLPLDRPEPTEAAPPEPTATSEASPTEG
ncbi:MAG: RluA family pseudouridine synthase [Myxococcota bacterium]